MKKLWFLFLIVLLVGCNKLDSGIVTRKYFVAEHRERYTYLVKSGSALIPVTGWRTIPDRWYVTIEGEYKGKTRLEDISLPEAEFEKIKIGDFIRVKGD